MNLACINQCSLDFSHLFNLWVRNPLTIIELFYCIHLLFPESTLSLTLEFGYMVMFKCSLDLMFTWLQSCPPVSLSYCSIVKILTTIHPWVN